jgi:peroxiredoxin (alkyl hydroperoxide reductase subunit C)
MTAVPAPLSVGDRAPGFSLKNQHGQQVALSDVLGKKNALLVFFPFAFSGICTGELGEIRDNLQDFQADDIEVFAISCDPMYAQRAWVDTEGYFFEVLSDFWPHGEVASAYGVFHEGMGAPIRGTFLIDRDGVIRWTLVNSPGERRDFSGYREALAALR